MNEMGMSAHQYKSEAFDMARKIGNIEFRFTCASWSGMTTASFMSKRMPRKSQAFRKWPVGLNTYGTRASATCEDFVTSADRLFRRRGMCDLDLSTQQLRGQ